MGQRQQAACATVEAGTISKICTSLHVTTDRSEMNNSLKKMYASLYTPDQDLNISELGEFFEIPSIEQEVTDCLDQAIAELGTAVKSFQSGK